MIVTIQNCQGAVVQGTNNPHIYEFTLPDGTKSTLRSWYVIGTDPEGHQRQIVLEKRADFSGYALGQVIDVEFKTDKNGGYQINQGYFKCKESRRNQGGSPPSGFGGTMPGQAPLQSMPQAVALVQGSPSMPPPQQQQLTAQPPMQQPMAQQPVQQQPVVSGKEMFVRRLRMLAFTTEVLTATYKSRIEGLTTAEATRIAAGHATTLVLGAFDGERSYTLLDIREGLNALTQAQPAKAQEAPTNSSSFPPGHPQSDIPFSWVIVPLLTLIGSIASYA